jgi:TonB dependent receptor
MRSSLRRGAIVALAVLALGSGLDGLAAEERFRGRLLAEVLEELRARGLSLVYSSAVVTAGLLVTVEPRSRRPRAVLDEILAPLGLAAREGPAGSLLIVAAPAGGEVIGPGGAGERVQAEQPMPRFVDEIVVTPGKLSIVREEQTALRSLGDRDAVLVPSIGGDLSRVIELLPGVAAADHSAAFHLRGSQPRDVALVLDGLELYEPFHLASFQAPFSLVDAGIVDRIDLFAGGLTADFGDRHGGFVKLSTWVPQEPGRARLEAGSLNSRFAYGAAGPDRSWLVSARAWYPEALRDTMELGEEGLDPRFVDAYAKVSRDLSPRTSVSVHGLFASDRLEFSEPEEAESVDYRNGDRYLWLRTLRTWSPALISETVLAGGRLSRSRQGISEPEDLQVAVSDRRVVETVGLRQDVAWELSGSHLLRAGLDVRRLAAEYRYLRETGADLTSRELDPAGTSVGLYLTHRASLAPSLAAELGVRWDRQTHSGVANTGKDQLSPRLNVLWRPGAGSPGSRGSELRLGIGRFYQSERIHELRIEDGETAFAPAELSRQVELTWQQELPRGLRLRLDAYDRRLSRLQPRSENLFNPIELFPETEADRILVRPESARLRGAELLLQTDAGRPLHGWASYAWSRARDRVDGRAVPRSWDQPHAWKWLVGYRPGGDPNTWLLALSGTVHTGWPTTPVRAEPTVLPDGSVRVDRVPGPRNSARYPNYGRLDAKASRAFAVPRGRLRLEVEVVNLTDRRNACCVDEILLETAPDGSPVVRRELDFWLGITPSLRLSWDF